MCAPRPARGKAPRCRRSGQIERCAVFGWLFNRKARNRASDAHPDTDGASNPHHRREGGGPRNRSKGQDGARYAPPPPVWGQAICLAVRYHQTIKVSVNEIVMFPGGIANGVGVFRLAAYG